MDGCILIHKKKLITTFFRLNSLTDIEIYVKKKQCLKTKSKTGANYLVNERF